MKTNRRTWAFIAAGALALTGLVAGSASAATGGSGAESGAFGAYEFVVHKTDPNGTPLRGATFVIALNYAPGAVTPEFAPALLTGAEYDPAAGVAAVFGGRSGERTITVTTDAQGDAAFVIAMNWDLYSMAGVLTFTETRAPAGFVAAAPATLDLVVAFDESVMDRGRFIVDPDLSDGVSFVSGDTVDLTVGSWEPQSLLAEYPTQMTRLADAFTTTTDADGQTVTAPTGKSTVVTVVDQPVPQPAEQPAPAPRPALTPVPAPQPAPVPEPVPAPAPASQPAKPVVIVNG